jgi:hypothetical protein
VAEKVVVVAPCWTVMEAGTDTALFVLFRLAMKPPEAAGPVSVSEHKSVPEPVT